MSDKSQSSTPSEIFDASKEFSGQQKEELKAAFGATSGAHEVGHDVSGLKAEVAALEKRVKALEDKK